MPSRKPYIIDLAARTVCARLGYDKRPRFHDISIVVGNWHGYQVEAQFDSGYLHSLAGPYWVRFELDGPERMYSVACYPDGHISMVRGCAGITPHYTSHFEFSTDAELERILNMIGSFIAAWEPETESA